MKNAIDNFNKYKPLLYELVARDIKTKYRRSVLGVLWTILNPLFMMIILSIVFSNFFKFKIENYSLYILSGQVLFNFFNEATSTAMSAILLNAPLIKKVYVPKYMFVLSRILSCAVNIMASFSALILVMIITRAELHYTVLLAVIPIASVVIFSLGVGLILAALAVKFRDVVHLYSVLMTAVLYLTPVIYPMSMLPQWVKSIVLMNPLTSIIEMFRAVVLYNTMPNGFSVAMTILPSALSLVIGLYIFYKNQDNFILYV